MIYIPLSTFVKVELRKGMCLLFLQMSLTQLPKAKRPLLMLLASASLSPTAFVFLTDSDPVKKGILVLQLSIRL